MEVYHRIVIDGENYYREYSHSMEKYDDLITEQELMEILLDQVVEDEIEISQERIEHALRRMADREDRELLNNYICYLERLVNE
jgi:hypothetical protein